MRQDILNDDSLTFAEKIISVRADGVEKIHRPGDITVLPVDLAMVRGPFARRLLEATARIPFGATSSYRDVATAAGNPAAVRAAWNALGANPVPIVVPCHRVLRTGGALGGYTGGLHRKERLLTLEGVLTAPLRG